ncbi:MarR family transcriptional regulator [Aurantimonas sp. Leaf443]|uniref:MarR family winged helix-turn-helix transcriptional regulator n=1 Tax=Aurantimonas sp. Leaf443 TaxID=1736378 RepID=UPI000701E287|nr:MarR family transcriptional regulator [Aurantimonas sp. Leaf443]KQT85921.1 MarR family transcriptional regulator [Aurantimonas sp. Leaf443]
MAGRKKKRSAIVELGLTARSCRTALSAELAKLDVYPGQDAVLLTVGARDGLSLRELADHLAVRPPTVTKTVARLAAQGLLEKRPSASDARQNHAFLTEKGRSVVDGVRAAQKAVEKTAMQGFSDRERKTLRKLLVRVARNVGGGAGAEPADDGQPE